MQIPSSFVLSPEVSRAIQMKKPIVALESAVITHGLPYPINIEIAMQMEKEARDQGVTPATVAVIDGSVHVGLQQGEIDSLASKQEVHKISARDFSTAIVNQWSGGTTVAGTILAASKCEIKVLATGGIGGVHRQPAYDISADLPQFSRTAMIVVCAGAKAILDLDATLEYLETHSIPVVGFQTDEFPAFYSRSSGLSTSASAQTAEEICRIALNHWSLGLSSSILVVNPPPVESALPTHLVEAAVEQALEECSRQNIRGQKVTPFLLNRVSEITTGASMKANLDLLINNARLATRIASSLSCCN